MSPRIMFLSTIFVAIFYIQLCTRRDTYAQQWAITGL